MKRLRLFFGFAILLGTTLVAPGQQPSLSQSQQTNQAAQQTLQTPVIVRIEQGPASARQGPVDANQKAAGDANSSKENVVTALLGFLGLVLGGIGALIAYFQWRTAHQRVVLDLFDRRFDVFSQIEEATKGIVNATSRKEMEAPFWTYVRAEMRARFLFGTDIIELLAKHRADIAAVRAFSNIRQDHPEYQQLNDLCNEALKCLAAFVQDSSTPFSPYMRLDQKMPSLWWQRSSSTASKDKKDETEGRKE